MKSGCKIVYSGDTIPCDRLARAGVDASILIHEATFDDSKEEMAAQKKHSTVSQAISMSTKMRAKITILTHFSARYPVLPVVDNSLSSKLVVAFDGMTVSLNPVLPLPTVDALLPDLEYLTLKGTTKP